MGCDYYASEGGYFLLKVTNADGEKIGELQLRDLEPGEELYTELLLGDIR